MALKTLRSILTISVTVILIGVLLPAERAQALSRSSISQYPPDLVTCVSHVRNGQSGELRGLYVPELFALPVVQQPAGDHQFVSPRHNIVTQFDLASRFGSIGLLAHNYLAGQDFSLLEKDQIFYLVYGDGRLSAFIVTGISRYQALEPESTSSRFVRLQDGAVLTTSELFAEVYHQDGNVVLQTCISRDNHLSWGRLFITAEPYSLVP